MSQNTKGTLELLAESWSSHNIDQLLSIYTEDGVQEDVTFGIGTHGKREQCAFAEAIFAAFPDFRPKSQFVTGEWAAMEWIMSGTHDGDVQGMPATHKKFSVRGTTIAQLDHPKIQTHFGLLGSLCISQANRHSSRLRWPAMK